MLYRKLFTYPTFLRKILHCFLLEFFLSVHCYRACVKLNSGHVIIAPSFIKLVHGLEEEIRTINKTKAPASSW